MSDNNSIRLLQKNRKAFFNYEMLEELECGIALVGTEVKSVREGRCSFSDSYITARDGKLTLIGFLIQPYEHGNIFNHKSDRPRTLLAHRIEIKKFTRKVNERGLTIVPVEIYLKGNLVKMKIALARGKNTHDKKEAIKERDARIDERREIRDLGRY